MVAPTSGGPHLPQIVGLFERRHPACRVVVTDIGFDDPLGRCAAARWTCRDSLPDSGSRTSPSGLCSRRTGAYSPSRSVIRSRIGRR